jgi:5-methylthioadenosine/S-adenosylhomocysteine deaminase
MLVIRNATIVTMNDAGDVLEGDVLVRDGRIDAIGRVDVPPGTPTLDAANGVLIPGFVQTHVHLCQTLFRGYADDLPLMEWLKRRVWPLEAAHSPASLRAAARLAACELLLGGTTSVLTMETVHGTDAVCEAVAESGLRATIGKCMMDADDAVPTRLREHTRTSIDESLALRKQWDGAADGRIRVAFAPRFAISCSRELLEAVGALSAETGALVHTHASESQAEIALVRERTGLENLAYLAAAGLASPRLCTAHCVWVDEAALALLAAHDVKVMHCPGSNLKLGSGLAPVVEMRARGITVSLGADGGACNNRLDMFDEMRLAATLQAVRKGPGALSARDAVWMATRAGARTLGLEREVGSIEIGKRADLAVVGVNRPHQAPGRDVYSTLVYATRASDVRATLVDGEVLVEKGEPTRMDQNEVVADAREAASALAARAGLL